MPHVRRAAAIAVAVLAACTGDPGGGTGGGSDTAGGGGRAGGRAGGAAGATAGGTATAGGMGGSGGSCGDTMTDRDNCGACGHSCLGGQCAAGKCQPVRLANVFGYPHQLVVDATHVYFTERRGMQMSHVYRAPIAGGATMDLATIPTLANGLQLSGGNVYVAVGEIPQLYRIPQAGGAPVPLVTGADGGAPTSLVIDGNRIIYATTRPMLSVVPLAGGAVADFANVGDVQALPQNLAIAGGYLYYANFGATGNVGRVPLSGGAPTPLASQPNAFDIVSDGTNAWFTAYADGQVKRVPVSGGTAEPIATGQDHPTGIAFDGQYVYWTNFVPQSLNGGSPDGSVVRAPIDGGAVEVLAAGLNGPYDIAVDARAVYWVNRWGLSVHMLAKP